MSVSSALSLCPCRNSHVGDSGHRKTKTTALATGSWAATKAARRQGRKAPSAYTRVMPAEMATVPRAPRKPRRWSGEISEM